MKLRIAKKVWKTKFGWTGSDYRFTTFVRARARMSRYLPRTPITPEDVRRVLMAAFSPERMEKLALKENPFVAWAKQLPTWP
jgi:hypothetical protein